MELIYKAWKKYSFIVLLGVVIASLFDFRLAVGVAVCTVAPLITSFFRGRFWCGNLCPRGSFYDNIISKISRHRQVPKLLKSIAFRVFVFLTMMSFFVIGIRKNWGNWYGIGFVFYRMIVITTGIGIILSLFWNERTWCHFCPMGSMSALVAALRRKRRTLNVSEECVSCRICTKVCTMEISPLRYRGSKLLDSDCLQCGNCVAVCPKKAISY